MYRLKALFNLQNLYPLKFFSRLHRFRVNRRRLKVSQRVKNRRPRQDRIISSLAMVAGHSLCPLKNSLILTIYTPSKFFLKFIVFASIDVF